MSLQAQMVADVCDLELNTFMAQNAKRLIATKDVAQENFSQT